MKTEIKLAKQELIKKMDYSKWFRKKVFKQMYPDQLQEALDEWKGFTDPDKEEWFDLNFNFDENSAPDANDMQMIMGLLKTHKFNIKRVFKDLKVYGEEKNKLEDKKIDEG